jgi:hypothetical protein
MATAFANRTIKFGSRDVLKIFNALLILVMGSFHIKMLVSLS